MQPSFLGYCCCRLDTLFLFFHTSHNLHTGRRGCGAQVQFPKGSTYNQCTSLRPADFRPLLWTCLLYVGRFCSHRIEVLEAPHSRAPPGTVGTPLRGPPDAPLRTSPGAPPYASPVLLHRVLCSAEWIALASQRQSWPFCHKSECGSATSPQYRHLQ